MSKFRKILAEEGLTKTSSLSGFEVVVAQTALEYFMYHRREALSSGALPFDMKDCVSLYRKLEMLK